MAETVISSMRDFFILLPRKYKLLQFCLEMRAVAILIACLFGNATCFRASMRTPMTIRREISMLRVDADTSPKFFPFSQQQTNGLSSTQLNAKKKEETANQGARQLLGLKGASQTTDIWKIRLQLCKPVTWIPLIWGVACGAAASGNYHTWNPFVQSDVPASLIVEDALKAFACMILSGPILTGYTQTINDWEDRAIDAINEPYRPIPSGAISEKQVIEQIWFLWISGLFASFGLDQWAGNTDLTIFKLTLFGTFIAYIYSAPPLKLKATGWAGSFALGSSYISLPWLCGQAMFGELSWPGTCRPKRLYQTSFVVNITRSMT